MNAPQAQLLPDGERLHLHHGPIDLIIGAIGPGRDTAFQNATERFQTILTGLAAELDTLRQAYTGQSFTDPIAQRMTKAVAPFADSLFITPMAAVAGAVADEMLNAMVSARDLTKAYVNNGGDIAFHLTEGQSVCAEGPAGPIEVRHNDPARGITTSGWQGRSHSLGIADAVTVVAPTAAMADAASTLIANAVDLPGHPAIKRVPATEVEAGHELGERLVTASVGALSAADVNTALDRGRVFAADCLKRGLILGSVLALRGQTRIVAP
ncbi:UPF0280 family protein [bacterium]|nr:UPF0280 family protein [bacterium]